ncbi:hypothetical protein ABIB35_001669 [Arthrobacter sp. UYP6]|uniref:HNH endonuclease signature motif containing protein n=1 Tax=Arthrobacter sp. UYP6 TaxID=1756378 RepID=UPI003398A0BD
MKTTTACGQRVEPPPDPLWFPDAAWPGREPPAVPWADDGGCPAGGDWPTGGDDWDFATSESTGSLAEEPTTARINRPETSSEDTDEGSVFFAGRPLDAASRQSPVSGLSAGLSGSLGLRSVPSLDQELTGSALQGLLILEGWAAAAQARLVHRQHQLMVQQLEQFNEELSARETARGRPAVTREVDRALAFSLTATEIATMLGIPEGTAKALVDESDELCERCPDTLALLERAEISPAQARTILDQTRSLVEEEAPAGPSPDASPDPGVVAQTQVFPPGAARAMEQELLKLAPGLTNAQFIRKARRLRERSYPKTIPVRHRTAFEQRRVWFQPQPDGMGHLTAYLPADKGQTIFSALTGAARGEQLLGDPRCLDQLRTDILSSLLLHTPEPWVTPEPSVGEPDHSDATGYDSKDGGHDATGSGARNGREARDGHETGNIPGWAENVSGTRPIRPGPRGHSAGKSGELEEVRVPGTGSANTTSYGSEGFNVPTLPSGPVAEIMVLINTETLFGADDAPAELAGYGPISAQDARRLARTARHWTGLVQDPRSGQILGVGRRRKVPAGLRRWLQARDQTCRFPGCSQGTARTEADHTIPWAQGGPTEHWNLANLCKKHHRMKTLGHWKARQVSPGVLEWISPLGLRYQTQPELTLRQFRPSPAMAPITESEATSEFTETPPPF